MDSQFNDWVEACSILGFDTSNMENQNNKYVCSQTFKNKNSKITITCACNPTGSNHRYTIRSFIDGVWDRTHDADSILNMCRRIDKIHNDNGYDLIDSCVLTAQGELKSAVTSAVNTRDLVKQMVRVKSSNVWAIGINIQNRKDKYGDILAQFKGPNGGPGDIYILYDVPIRVYRRWQTAPSKGHYYWQYLRNNYKYSKLTGDKRGKLKNAIN